MAISGAYSGDERAGGVPACGWKSEHRAAYVAFGRFPAAKGSAVHIAEMTDELFTRYDGGLLAVLGGPDLPRYQREPGGREIARFAEPIPNLLDRAEAFSSWVAAHLAPHLGTLEVCHVRDPWGALPAVTAPGRRHRVVFEVNGLPSIEMTHTWPLASPGTPGKVREPERFCLERSDAVVVPSSVIAEAVGRLGVEDRRIHLVPNGADPVRSPRPGRPAGAPGRYVIYVKAVQPWQGVDVLLRAFARLADLPDLRLVVCSSVPERRCKPLRRLAERLGVDERVDWMYTLPHAEVAAWLAHAGLPSFYDGMPNVALEAAALGVPLLASDAGGLADVADEEIGFVFPAGDAHACRAARASAEELAKRGAAGEERIRRDFTPAAETAGYLRVLAESGAA
ncbi:hypothetical protein Acsp03_34530 [Actinomadura sp. NBRC 104412]|uniref:glycosyltransferase n=1 Tax=Actinomadura sp. NBRC 104412 TaxID=3032203 RepID=UPI0024A41C68|nr:glycosyltransferase [Actinomadura sp. NBRC 104412]GLZ05987.1 hypothetical protein Acsp03_34530 [Actinomadura sp. NBRC 104412]